MLDNDLLTLALLRKTQNFEIETYDGETEVTLLDSDRTFSTAGKLVNQELKAKLGYEVIHSGMEITAEEWVSEGAPGIGPGSSGTGPSTVTYQPKEYEVTEDIAITNPVAYPGGIKMKVDHTIEDALLQNTPIDEYYNDRIVKIGFGNTQQGTNFQCTQIKKITLPNIEHCPPQYAFTGRNVSLLEELYVPKLIDSGYGFAEGNPNLRIVDFGKSFGGAKCRNCPNLEVLIVRDASFKSLGSDWLTGCTKMLPDGSGGIVYVPQNLLAQYQASEAWQTYANVEFRPIEGSEYELEDD